MQGTLIVFEGVEGAGKTTQMQLLQTWLSHQSVIQRQGWPIVVTREPGGTELGRRLREILLTTATQEDLHDRAELLLYAADRAQHVESFLKPWLAKGAIILCDRYTDSTLAYQGYGRGIDQPLIQQANALATAGLTSNLTLWLDLPVEIGLARTRQRGEADRIEQANLAFHRRVQQGYLEMAARDPQRIRLVNAARPIEQVAAQIQQILKTRFPDWALE